MPQPMVSTPSGTLHSRAPLCFFAEWIATGCAGQAVSALQRLIKDGYIKSELGIHSERWPYTLTFLVPTVMFAYVAVLNERAVSCTQASRLINRRRTFGVIGKVVRFDAYECATQVTL